MDYEQDLYDRGYKNVVGIDEVGRGCLAGDVLSCAIIMPKDSRIKGIVDSKKTTPKQREKLYEEIKNEALAIGIGKVGPKDIDKINIKEATRLAMKFAVENLRDRDNNPVKPDFLLIDAENIDLDIEQMSIIKGDDKSYSIACASIFAKVYRDRLCNEWDKEYPGYNIKQHKGYGTPEHRKNIKELGPSKIHRMSFLKNILKDD